VAVCPAFQTKGYRATRLVVMPEWQGAGVGVRFLNTIAQMHVDGEGRCGRRYPVYFHTSHPQLCAALRRMKGWQQMSAVLHGPPRRKPGLGNLGVHFRAVQGFRYSGVPA
jgi:GNAT superfamily N-acetyltransferase